MLCLKRSSHPALLQREMADCPGGSGHRAFGGLEMVALAFTLQRSEGFTWQPLANRKLISQKQMPKEELDSVKGPLTGGI